MKRLYWLLLILPLAARAQVTTTNFSVTYTCTGSVGPYTFNFPVSTASALTVTQNGSVLSSAAYTIVPVNNNYDNGGKVTLAVACPAAQTLILKRVTPLTQTSIFFDNMPVPMFTVGSAVDKLTEIAQELAAAGSTSSMVYPSAGIANSSGAAWGTSYNGSNIIPANFLPLATSSTPGTVQVDNTTCVVTAGVLSCTGNSGSPFTSITVNGSPGTSTFKYLAGSPTASGNTNVSGMIAACLFQPCTATIDPAYTGTDTYGTLADQTYITDQRYAQNGTTAYNWAHLFANGYYDANQANCPRTNQPGLTTPVTYWQDVCGHMIFSSSVPGWNEGSFWNVAISSQIENVSYSAGIQGGLAVNCTHTGIGDDNCAQAYQIYTSGFVAPNDEGVVPLRSTAIEQGGMFTALVTSHTTNALNQTVLTLNSPSLSTHMGVGRPVIDKTSNVVSGTAGSISTSPGIATVAVTGFTPATSSCGTTIGGLVTQLQPMNGGYAMSISLTGLSAGALSAGQQITIAGPGGPNTNGGGGGGHIETAKIASAGSYSAGNQTIVANLIYAYATGATVCGGGLQGYIEQTNYTYSGYRYLQYVIGAPTSSSLLVAIPWGSNGINNFMYSGPIKVYQGGTLVDVRDLSATNNAVDGNQITVMANSASWGASDSIEVSDLASGNVTGIKSVIQNQNPFAPVVSLVMEQTGATLGQSNYIILQNGFSANQLTTHGGSSYSPPALYTSVFGAPMAAGLVMSYAPEGGKDLLPTSGTIPAAAIYVGPWATTTAAVTAYSITGNVITLTVSNTYATGGGQPVTMSGFGSSTFLNGQTFTSTSATATTIVGAFTHANTSATEAGTVTVGSTLTSYYPWYDGTAGKNLSFNPSTGTLTTNVTKFTGLPNATSPTDACNLQTCQPPLTGISASIGGSLLASAGTCTTGTVSVTGAVPGYPVAVSASDGTLPNSLIVLSASVTSSNTVTVQLCAIASVTPAAKTYNVAVLTN